eukprot:m.40972 g.40972  ORF g.40972 m.40972 type:complete len:348 (-) comp46092_c0_seq2:167-1210(-)
MGQSTSREDFEWRHDQEPHKTRRTEILKQHPEIKKLMVVDPMFKWKVTMLVCIQFISVYFFQDLPWLAVVPLAYIISGTINHSLLLAVHEISHNQAFGGAYPELNKWFGLFANTPIGVPMACSFKKYHLLHHRYQGQEGIDTDLPTPLEGRLFRSPAMKAFWLFLQPIMYGIRPFFVNPLPVSPLEAFNVVYILSLDAAIFWFFGPKMLFYLAGGTILSMGLHPMAGHVIAEHYLWAGVPNDKSPNPDNYLFHRTPKQSAQSFETFSYFGPLNLFAWNVGYHVAHHDFPSIPGSLLPEVHKIAPEWYDDLPAHPSWTGCMIEFIMNPNMGPFTRLKRDTPVDASKQE